MMVDENKRLLTRVMLNLAATAQCEFDATHFENIYTLYRYENGKFAQKFQD